MGITTVSHLFLAGHIGLPKAERTAPTEKRHVIFSAPTEKKARNLLSPHREKSKEFSQPPPRKKHGIFSAPTEKKARNFLSLHREKSAEFSQPPPREKRKQSKIKSPRQPDCALGYNRNKHCQKAKTTKIKLTKGRECRRKIKRLE